MLENGISPKTVNRKISCLKTYFKFLLRQNIITTNPMQKIISPKSGKKLPEFVKEAEMNQLLNSIDFGEDFEGIRNKLIIETFYLTGIRVSELTQINNEDVRMNSGEIRVKGKGGKERLIPVSDYLVKAIKKYLPLRTQIQSDCNTSVSSLFITKRGKE